ncbi:hypothetical protein SAMN06269185_2981 [Natronoarchaeum philippinense]|uniref:Uncharacterized protein n=1 Tax=Natronoarchaeum philippinense TaxID=558529 RepID=A0A285P6F4_NATPI|nr:hypothetical protein [Natronoarchaeum philippinense]SNZ17315.1 hypothetical protein SAMN06269185_2981 [Natronoarchaeum philippinense]
MSERTDQLSAEASSDDDAAGGRSFDTGIDDSLLGGTDAKAEPADDDAEGSRLGGYFSIRTFLVLLVGLAVLSGIGRSIVPIVSGLGSLLGAFAGAFLVGLISSKRRYAETGLAAALLGAFSAIPGFVTFGLGLQSVAMIAAVGGGIGLVVALLGVYFGRDLRDGLTRDI